MSNHIKIVVIGLAVLLLGAGTVLGSNVTQKPHSADAWADDYEAYALDSALHGQGGWTGWDDNAAATGYIRNYYSVSPTQSLEVENPADMVHTFTNCYEGIWIFTVYQYVPSTQTGDQYVILMNTYNVGNHLNQDWSMQLLVSTSSGTISDYNDAGMTLPLLTDQWVQIRDEINLDTDVQTVYYGGVQLQQCEWKDHCYPGGAQNVGCVDLYGGEDTTGTPMYYDDISIARPSEVHAHANGPYSGVIGVPIQFTGTADGGVEPYTYAWQFGDGASSSDQNPTHAYASAGDFTAILTVTDDNGATGQDTATVTVAGPTIEITAIKGGSGVTATVANTGGLDATNVSWTISLSGGILIKGKTLSGTIPTLAAGADTTVTSKVIGFGKVTITATAGDAEKTASGFVFLMFVLGVK
jgi:hypothetical protein